MINPHFIYAFAFSFALVVYPLGWSALYPPMSLSTVTFIITTILIHGIAGVLFRNRIASRSFPSPPLDIRLAVTITIFIYALWLVEFTYGGGIPLVEILSKKPFDYKTFGVPHLHVLVVTFSSFFTILLFHRYVTNGSRHFLILWVINLLAALLIYNRGMFLFNLAGCFFLYLSLRSVNVWHIAVLLVSSLILLFLFGTMGSMRVSNESQVSYTNHGFLTSGAATLQFRNSGIPAEYFWAYIYTTSPLANLETTISTPEEKSISASGIFDWLNNEVLPDFISKRINRLQGIEPRKIRTIPGPFNATTVYAGSFLRLGWWGLLFMSIITLVLPWLYTKIVAPESPYFLSGFAILNALFLFMIFDNTLRFTGFSFQLAYPFLLGYLWRGNPLRAILSSKWTGALF